MSNETAFRIWFAFGGMCSGVVLMIVISFCVTAWVGESPQQAYERGKIDGQFTDSTMPYVTVELIPPSEIVRQITEDDTLYFWRQQLDTGFVLKPIYRVLKLWTPEDSMESWEYEEWLNTSRGWYGWDVSEALMEGWYDGVDSTYSVHEAAMLNWALSVLTKERTFIIYFDSTDTMPVMEMEGVEVRDGN